MTRKKRFDLPRARVDGMIHDVRPKRKVKDNAHYEWLRHQGYWESNVTKCGREFRHKTLPATYEVNCMECIGMSEIDFLRFEVEQLKKDHQTVCNLVAQMHAAAVGEVRGPMRGVVEDVEDVRAQLLAETQRCNDLSEELRNLRARLENAYETIAHLHMVCLSA